MDCHIPGESSCKKPGASNKMSDSDRPLKKARFAWQVKGKYHLRDQEGSSADSHDNNSEIINTPTDLSDSIPASVTPESDTTCKAEENLEILGDYLLKQDFSGLGLDTNAESLDTGSKPTSQHAESISSNPSSSVSYPVYVPSEESASGLKKNVYINLSQNDAESSTPSGADSMNALSMLSMAQQSFKTEDHCLARWQARQLAKGFVDNTINRVLESWFVSPMPPFENNCHTALALDVAEFFEFLPADNRVENEGILMAISAHGLHNNNANNLREPERERILNLPLGRGFGAIRHRSLSDSIFIRENYLNSFNSNENDDNTSNDPPVTDFECLSDTESSPEDNSKSRSSPTQAVPSFNLRNSLKRPIFESMMSSDNIPNVDTSSMRHFPNSCNCRNIHTRRNHAVSGIPFHRRDNLDLCPILPSRTHECSSNSESVPSTLTETVSNEPPKSPESCLNRKPADSSSDDESDDQVKNDFMESDEQMQEHFDFMDAAVSFAIQNKGLTSFGSVDYG